MTVEASLKAKFLIRLDLVNTNIEMHEFNDPNEVLDLFSRIDWFYLAEQMKCSDITPTFTIFNRLNHLTMWASVVGNYRTIEFIVDAELNHFYEKKILWLFKSQRKSHLSLDGFSLDRTKLLMSAFLHEQHEYIFKKFLKD